jgi:hypothetical protein
MAINTKKKKVVFERGLIAGLRSIASCLFGFLDRMRKYEKACVTVTVALLLLPEHQP